jgi:aryl-alcohol dehydrogenase-like predicted oxidoreductase
MVSDRFMLGGDLDVSRLGFGALRVTGKGCSGPPEDPDAMRALVCRVVDLGINLIDTADSYGPELSETLIAEALHPYPEGLVIATKGGLRGDGRGRVQDARPERLKECCEGSLRRLRLECIDLYQLHAPDPQVPLEESLGALRELQQAGKIRHIGVSNVSARELERAGSVAQVVSVQDRYNLADRHLDGVLAACERQGMAFIPSFPLDDGRLAHPGGPLHALARMRGATPAQLAIAWLLRRSPVMLPIPGTSRVEHLEENIDALALELSDEDMERLNRCTLGDAE